MTRQSGRSGPGGGTAVVLPVGKVAALLGVPAMTIRSWETRYGMTPSRRSPGRHRRYTGEDIARLRRMKTLIAQGVAAQDAARISQSGAQLVTRDAADVAQLEDMVRNLAVDRITGFVVDSLHAVGAATTWEQLAVPLMHRLDERSERPGDCTELEIVFARCATDAVARYLATIETRRGKVVLLVPCPAERHLLPLTFLRAAIREQGQPVILLGPDAPPPAIVRCADQLRPSHIVLWSLAEATALPKLRNQLARRGHQTLTAGPGWPAATQPLNDLGAVLSRVMGRSRRQRIRSHGI